MHTLSFSWKLLFLRKVSAGPRVAKTIYEHRRNAHYGRGVWLCKHLYFYHPHFTWAHFQVWTPEIPINICWYLCGLECLPDILEDITWSPRPTLGPKATSNEELGTQYLNQESSINQEFKSIATSTAGNCTLYSLKLKALLDPFNLLKESLLITPTTFLNLTQDIHMELDNGALRSCNLHPTLTTPSSLHFPVYTFRSMRTKREKGVSGTS